MSMLQTPVNDRCEDSSDISLLALDQYTRQVTWTEPFEPGEVARLLSVLCSAKQSPDNTRLAMCAQHARDRLVEGWQPLVLAVARSFSRVYSFDRLDLVQEANLGLLRLLDQVDFCGLEDREAFLWVNLRRAVLSAIRGRCSTVTVQKNIDTEVRRLGRVRTLFQEQEGRVPAVAELARWMQVEETRVYDLLLWEQRMSPQSLHSHYYGGSEKHADYEPEYQPLYGAAAPVCDEQTREQYDVICSLIQTCLDGRQRSILSLRYGLGGETDECLTLSEIARHLGIDVRCIHAIEKRARGRLQRLCDKLQNSSSALPTAHALFEDVYTFSQVQHLLGMVTANTVRSRVRAGCFPALKRRVPALRKDGVLRTVVMTVFPKEAVDGFLASRRLSPVA